MPPFHPTSPTQRLRAPRDLRASRPRPPIIGPRRWGCVVQRPHHLLRRLAGPQKVIVVAQPGDDLIWACDTALAPPPDGARLSQAHRLLAEISNVGPVVGQTFATNRRMTERKAGAHAVDAASPAT